MIEERQNFKQSSGVLNSPDIRRGFRAVQQAARRVKLYLPFDGKPTFKNRDDFARSNRDSNASLGAPARES